MKRRALVLLVAQLVISVAMLPDSPFAHLAEPTYLAALASIGVTLVLAIARFVARPPWLDRLVLATFLAATPVMVRSGAMKRVLAASCACLVCVLAVARGSAAIVVKDKGGPRLGSTDGRRDLRYSADALEMQSADGSKSQGCYGDSGGPALARPVDGTRGPTVLVVLSRGVHAEDSAAPCHDGAIYTRADAEAAWIREASATADQLVPSPRRSDHKGLAPQIEV